MLKKHQLTSGIQLLSFLVTLILVTSCSTLDKRAVKTDLKKEAPFLNQKEIQLVGAWVKKLPKCQFLFLPVNINTSASTINQCAHQFRHSKHDKSTRKLQEGFIDNYLGEMLSPHLAKFSTTELTKVLNRTLDSMYAMNPKFIKSLLDRGATTKHILLQQIHWWSSTTDGCEVVMLILNKNAYLYKDQKTLNEAMPYSIGGKTNPKNALYRRDALFPFTYNHAHSVRCPNVIIKLLKINPDLRDSINSNNETPLHDYMDLFPNQISIGKKLISKKNINKQDAYGRTPLHILLHYVTKPDRRIIEMTKALLASGAKIDLKNKKGLTARDMLIKLPELVKLLKSNNT